MSTRRTCFDVVIVDDTSVESQEEFILDLTLDRAFIPDTVTANPNRTTIIIRDNDVASGKLRNGL